MERPGAMPRRMLALAIGFTVTAGSGLSGGAMRADQLVAFGLVLGLLAGGGALLTHAGSEARSAAALAAVAVALVAAGAHAALSPFADAGPRGALAIAVPALAFAGSLFACMGDRVAAARLLDGVAGGATLVGLHAISAGTGAASALHHPFVNHGQLGALLATGSLAAVAALPRSASFRDVLRGPALARLAAALVLALLTAATLSRSAMIALAVVLVVSVPLVAVGPSAVRTRGAAALVLALGLAAAAGWAGTLDRLRPGELRSSSIQERLGVWQASAKLAWEAPPLGFGVGAYRGAIWRHATPSTTGSIEHAHSQPLEALAEKGVLGCLPVLLAAAVIGYVLHRGNRDAALRGSPARETLLGAVAASLVVPVQSLFDVTLVAPALAALSAAALGAAAGVACTHAPSTGSSRPAAVNLAFAAALSAAFVAWGARNLDRMRLESALARADRDASAECAREVLASSPRDRLALRYLAQHGEPERFVALAAADRHDPYAAMGAAGWLRTHGDVYGAERELRRAVEAYPAGYDPKRQLLELLAFRGALADAIALARRVRDEHPAQAPETILWLARAMTNPLLAEELAPRDAEGRRAVARGLLEGGDAASARRLLSALDGREDRLLRAHAAVSAGDSGAARSEARALLANDPHDAAAAILLASLRATPAETAEAERALRQAAETDVSAAPALATLLDSAERAVEADAWLDERLAAHPSSVPLLALRASRRERSGDVTGAMEDARRLMDLRPSDPSGPILLARLYERKGFRSGARDLYRKALRSDPANAEALRALERLGN